MADKKSFNDEILKRFDPFTDEPRPTKEDFQEFSEKLTALIKGTEENAKKKKMSYSISPSVQALIKNLSEESGATQGSIIDLAPFFFGAIIEKSLKRREDKLPLLKTIVRQIAGSLSGFALNAPHLENRIKKVEHLVREIYEMEKDAVATKNYQGVDFEKYPSFSDLDISGEAPPYFKEIEEFIGEDSPFKSLFKLIFS